MKYARFARITALTLTAVCLIPGCSKSAKGPGEADLSTDTTAHGDAVHDQASELSGDLQVSDVPSDGFGGEVSDLPNPEIPETDLLDAAGDQGQPPDVQEPDPGPLPFSEGPYGVTPGSVAGPFVLPTLSGDWDFEKRFSGGNDSYVFLLYASGYPYMDQIWNSNPADLFRHSPPNAHYFFLSYEADAQDIVTQQKQRVQEALESLGTDKQTHWSTRVHFVPQPVSDMDNWITDVLKNKGYFAFCIDRTQRLRETGMLMEFPGDQLGKMRFLRHEVEYFNYLWDLDERLAAEPDVVQVPVFQQELFDNVRHVDVSFPDAETMAGFDTLEMDMFMACDNPSDSSCGEWDYLADMHLCRTDDPEVCDLEVGRWITAYGRPGRWVTDISSLLALVKEGGVRRFKMNNTWQAYRLTLTFRLSNRSKGAVPVEFVPLWKGGWFNLDYNPAHPPIEVDIPDGAKRVEIVAYITGHGFAWDKANCAEFCNHQHHFTVNGTTYKKEHPEAGTNSGCLLRVPEGVTPNQFGTWPLGRGGWCPGLDVAPWVADLTAAVHTGTNTIEYRALYFNQPYDPKPSPDGGGATPGNIAMSSYLVVWH
jgi:hypothetical protein